MDFIWSANPHDSRALIKAMQLVGIAPQDIALTECGFWGALLSTRSPYYGLQPFMDDDAVVVVVGDPLLKLKRKLHGNYHIDTFRSRLIKEHWVTENSLAALTPHHPGTIFCIDKIKGQVEIIIDSYGAVPLFFSLHRGLPIVATSPDLIAAVVQPSLDTISATELLVAQRISFPYTIYRGIKQLAPGSVHEPFSGTCKRWWNPPLPVYDKSPQEWAELIRNSTCETLNIIAQYVGSKGITTLSAGQDTRIVSTLAVNKMELEAVTVTAISNPESWVARRVARQLGIPHRHILRQPQHYGILYKSRPLVLSSQNLWTHAHFHLNSLKTPASTAFVLGGYTADALFRQGGIHYTKWKKIASRSKHSSLQLTPWMVNDLALYLNSNTIDIINDRWSRGDKLLGLSEQHSQDLVMAYPLSRQISAAHFHAARRNGPQYEVFMTKEALDLAYSIPAKIKCGENSVQEYLFCQEKKMFSDIEKQQEILNALIKKRKNSLPNARIPKWWSCQGAWGCLSPPQSDKQLIRMTRKAQKLVALLLDFNPPENIKKNMQIWGIPCLQIETASKLCSLKKQ